MNEQKVLATLATINTWWYGNEIPKRIKKSDNKRKIFYNLFDECLGKDEIISISGPRQVGKTTLIGQLIESQIKNKIERNRIIYLPLDNEALKLNTEDVFFDCLKVFFDFIVGESLENLSKKVYIYLDEIQSMDNWAKKLKTYYDTYDQIKFIISGSSQTRLYSDASESLVGRILFRIILPFKFREFMEYYLVKRSNELDFSGNKLKEALKKSIENKNPKELYRVSTVLKIKLSSELPVIKKLIESYLIKGGYPGLLDYDDNYDSALEKLKTDLELTVYKDIYKIFNTRNSSDLMSLLTLLANSSGQKVNHTNLGNTIGVDRRVIASYIQYSKLVYLVGESPFCKINIHKKIEKMAKVYLNDVGHRNALVGKMGKEILQDAELGLVIQTAVFNHACKLQFFLSKYTNYEVCYWENKNTEVDIVFHLPFLLLPTEVKSSRGDRALKALYSFIEEHKESQWGMIITQDELKIDKNILYFPLWAFLLMC